MTTIEILRTARKLLSNPKRWTKYYFESTNDEGVTCYCALGALRVAAGGEAKPLYGGVPEENRTAFKSAAERVMAVNSYRFSGIPSWNDNSETTYKDVMETFSKACEAEYEAVVS